jgi:hypothetical protein
MELRHIVKLGVITKVTGVNSVDNNQTGESFLSEEKLMFNIPETVQV